LIVPKKFNSMESISPELNDKETEELLKIVKINFALKTLTEYIS
jgi:hypothetical protein